MASIIIIFINQALLSLLFRKFHVKLSKHSTWRKYVTECVENFGETEIEYLRYFLTVAYWNECMSVSQKCSFGVKVILN